MANEKYDFFDDDDENDVISPKEEKIETPEEKEEKENKEKKKNHSSTLASTKPEKKRKLTFKEKQEMLQLERELETLNQEKHDIENTLNSGTLSTEELLTKSNRIAEIIRILDEKEMRWLELSEIDT